MSSVKLQHNTPLSDTGNLSYLNNGTLSLEIQSILDDIEQKVHATITEDANLEDIDTEQHDNSLNDGENNEELDYYQEKIENYLESKRAYDRSAPIFQKLKISPFYSLNQEEQAMLANAINYILQ